MPPPPIDTENERRVAAFGGGESRKANLGKEDYEVQTASYKINHPNGCNM